MRRFEDMSDNARVQLLTTAEKFEYFSIALDESCDVGDTSQLLVFVRGVDSELNVTEDLAALQSLYGTTKGTDTFEKVCDTLRQLSLPWDKLASVTTDGAKSMVGHKTGVIRLISHRMDTIGAKRPLAIHCIIHQQALCSKSLDVDSVLKVVFSTVNFTGANALNHRQFKSFLDEADVKFKDILYHTAVRWLSRGKVLTRFFQLRAEIAQFMAAKGRAVPQLEDQDWMWQLAFLADLTQHLNTLNLSLQGKDHIVNEMLDAIAFCLKLKLFRSHLRKSNYVQFPMVSQLHDTLTSPFPLQWALEAMVSLINQFNSRFRYFTSHREEIRLFANPFDADVDTVPEDIQLEIIDLQADDTLRCVLREQGIMKFYKQLPTQKYEYLRKFASRMITVFGGTCICGHTFSRMKLIQSKTRSRLTDEHLHGQLRLSITSFDVQIDKLVSNKQAHASH